MDERAADTGAARGGVNILLRPEGLTLFGRRDVICPR
jgi:hypothetical protein